MQQSCYYSNNNLKSKCSQEKLWLALMINWENNVFTWGFWILSWILYEVEFHDTCHWFKSVLFFDCIAGLFWSRPFETPQMLHGDRACYPESLLWSCLLSSPKKLFLGFSPKCIRHMCLCESIWKPKSRLSNRMMGFLVAIKLQLSSNFNDPVTTRQSLICIAFLLVQRFSADYEDDKCLQ